MRPTIRFVISSVSAAAFVVACAKDGSNSVADSSAATVAAASGTVATGIPATRDLEDRVETSLNGDATLKVFGLDADEDDGKIILKGVVRTAEQKALAVQIASTQAPGASIDDRIRIDPAAKEKTVDIDDVEERVEDAIEADTVLKSLDIDVDEDNGQLVLEGKVKTAEQKAAAEAIATRIAAPVVVISKLRVEV